MSLLVSASQLKTWLDCSQKWAFEKVEKLPTGPSSYGATFGSAFHAVVERWLTADDTGRDLEGKAVDLYPPGWDDGLKDGDGDMVRKIVKKMVEEGFLSRSQHRKVEEYFLVPLASSIKSAFQRDASSVHGYIDLLEPGKVTDHKTMGTFRYALDEDGLANDTQMLIYAKIAMERYGSSKVTLRHNQVTRKGQIRIVETKVGKSHIQKKWREVQAIAERMAEEPPEKNLDACQKYGGCPFLPICTGQETVEEYRARHERLRDHREEKQSVWDSGAISPIPQASPGLRVLHGCTTSEALSLREVFLKALELAGNTPEQFYLADAFKRRDALMAMGGKLAETLGDVDVSVGVALTPDMRALVEAILPFASSEVFARAT